MNMKKMMENSESTTLYIRSNKLNIFTEEVFL
jgi:hypothetical protein